VASRGAQENKVGDAATGRTPRHLRGALLAGATYFVVGILFGDLAGAAASIPIRNAWRLAAWVVSAAVFGTHILHETLRVRSSARVTAWYASSAAALGSFGLAAAMIVHTLRVSEHTHWTARLLSLVIWPAGTLLPAFVVALPAAALLRRRAQPKGADGAGGR
jgi:hypothetical protein